MIFDFTEEQNLLREAARKAMEKDITPVTSQHDPDQPLPKEVLLSLMKKLIPLGYIGGTLPEKDGGMGLGMLSYGILMEELDRALTLPVGILGAGIAPLFAHEATEDLKRRILPPLLRGEKIACFGATEPNVGSNPAAVETKAVKDGDSYIINGSKMWCSNGHISDVAVILASVDRSLGPRGLAIFVVERDKSPYSSRDIPLLGLNREHVSELIFEDCRVPASNMLVAPGDGLKNTLRLYEVARCALVGMTAVALAKDTINWALKYVQERYQFGKPIGSFQIIQEMLADMATEYDAARFLVYRALYLWDKGAWCVKEFSMGKFYSTEAAERIASKAIAIGGGYGLSKEYPAERFYRDAKSLTIPDGTAQIQRLIIGRELTGLRAFD